MTHHDKSRVAVLAADGELRIRDDHAQIDVVVDERRIRCIEVVESHVREVVAQLDDLGGGLGVHLAVDDLVALAQIADLAVGTQIAFKRVEGEILGKVRDGDILQNLVVDLIVDAQLVGLGHLDVVVGDLDAAVVRNVVHLHVGVDGTRRNDIVVVILGGGVVALGIGVLQEIL